MITYCLQAGKTKVLVVASSLVLAILLADRAVGNSVSLGVLYILPVMLGAVVLPPAGTAAFAVLCSLLRAWFDTPGSRAEVVVRFIFATLGYYASGLFVTGIVRNREMVVRHLHTVEQEQQLRHSAEEQLKLMVEGSPAAILTIDGSGVVLAANAAAEVMFEARAALGLRGKNIARYLPVLSDAVRFKIGPEAFRTAAQCQGRRENGDIFVAHTWFSSYQALEGMRLGAIVVDSSEEMRAREEQNLQQFREYNHIAAAALSHEVRNVCAAINLLSSTLSEKHGFALDPDYQGLTNLIGGLEKVASLDLQSRVNQAVEATSLQAVLDNLRIIVEPEWREMGAVIHWPCAEPLPGVLADPQGLLQVFLNLTQNSYRALQECAVKQLTVRVLVNGVSVAVQLHDSGPGIASPEQLFQPFGAGAAGSGLGLYISRAILRSYGGELRLQPAAAGTCFAVELQVV